MRVVKGDKVIIISGKDKGKTGIIQKSFPKTNKVIVEGVNVHKKHLKPTQARPEGGIIEVFSPIDASNVSLIDPKTKKATRVAIKVNKDGKKVRVAKKSGQEIK